jgi:hypothetical protein
MNRSFYLLLCVLLTSIDVPADSIRIGDVQHRDVYIRTGKDFYFVYFPNDGTMERVARRRSNVSGVEISEDAAYRESLWDRYEATKANPPEAVATPPVPRTLEGDLLKHRESMKALALFEAQLAHWKALPPDAREAIAAGREQVLARRTAQRALEHERALAQRQALEGTKAAVAQEWASAAEARAAAVRQVQAEDQSDFYLRAYENSKGYVGPTYYFYRDWEDNLRVFPTWWYTEDPSLYDAALEERATTSREIGAVERDYAARAKSYDQKLEKVEKGISLKERIARSAVAKVADDHFRIGNQQSRIDLLIEAADTIYVPQFRADTLAAWSGSAAQRTPEFTVGRGVWQLNCVVVGPSDGFSATLYNAKTNQPFTRIAGPDFLGMRLRVFDEPGTYYLEIDPGAVPGTYAIDVSALSLR